MTLVPLALAAALGGTPVLPAGGELVQVAFWPRPQFIGLQPWGSTRCLVSAYDMVGAVRIVPGEQIAIDWLAPGPYRGWGLAALDQGPIYVPGREDNFAIVDTTGVLLDLIPQDEPPRTMTLDRSSLFVGGASRNGLESYDISDPLAPRLISSVVVGSVSEFALTEEHVFTGGWDPIGLSVSARMPGDSLVLLEREWNDCIARYIAYSPPWLLSSGEDGLYERNDGCQQVTKFEGDSLHVAYTDVDIRFSGDLEVVDNRIYAVGRVAEDSTFGIATLEPREPAKLVLIDFLPLDHLDYYARLAWFESGYLLASGEREGLTLLSADPDGTLHERDWIGLPGQSWRFDLRADLLVSAEIEYGMRWVRHPFDSELREFGHASGESWRGVAIVPGTDLIVGQRSPGTVETFRLEERPVPVSFDSLAFGFPNDIVAVPGFTAIMGSGPNYDLFALDGQGHLDLVEHVDGIDGGDIVLEMWNDTLAIFTEGEVRQELRTYAPGDTATVLRTNWAPECGTPFGLDVLGREVAYATGCAIEIWDVTDPDAPSLTGQWRPPPGQFVESVVLAPGYAVASTWGDSLYLLDRGGPEIRRVASAMLPDRTQELKLALDAGGRPHVVCNMNRHGYLVFTLRDRIHRSVLAPSPPPELPELWGF